MRQTSITLLSLTTAILGLFSLPAFAGPDITLPGRWSAEPANGWFSQQPCLVGCNFTPSTAINQLEMWQADTFVRSLGPGIIESSIKTLAEIGKLIEK